MINPLYQLLFGKEGLEGSMLSILYHSAEMLSEGDWYKNLPRVIFEEGLVMSLERGLRRSVYNAFPLVSECIATFRLPQANPRNVPRL